MENFQFDFRNTVYIAAQGSLDSITSQPLIDAVEKKLESVPEELFILDLNHVDFMNSLGLAAIIRIWKKAQQHNKSVRILTNKKMADIFKISHLDTIIDLYILESVPKDTNVS
jgi:anti-anti-sigma factor